MILQVRCCVIFVHLKLLTWELGSIVPLPFNLATVEGNMIVVSLPAFANDDLMTV
jgi:hypothetical protein